MTGVLITGAGTIGCRRAEPTTTAAMAALPLSVFSQARFTPTEGRRIVRRHADEFLVGKVCRCFRRRDFRRHLTGESFAGTRTGFSPTDSFGFLRRHAGEFIAGRAETASPTDLSTANMSVGEGRRRGQQRRWLHRQVCGLLARKTPTPTSSPIGWQFADKAETTSPSNSPIASCLVGEGHRARRYSRHLHQHAHGSLARKTPTPTSSPIESPMAVRLVGESCPGRRQHLQLRQQESSLLARETPTSRSSPISCPFADRCEQVSPTESPIASRVIGESCWVRRSSLQRRQQANTSSPIRRQLANKAQAIWRIRSLPAPTRKDVANRPGSETPTGHEASGQTARLRQCFRRHPLPLLLAGPDSSCRHRRNREIERRQGRGVIQMDMPVRQQVPPARGSRFWLVLRTPPGTRFADRGSKPKGLRTPGAGVPRLRHL